MSSGLDWVFKIVDGASGPVSKITSALGGLTTSLDKTGKSLKGLGEEHGKTGEKAKEHAEKSESLFKELLKFETLKKSFELATEGAKMFFETLLEADSQQSRLDRGLKRFGANADEARDAIDLIAKKTSLTNDETEKFTLALGKAGFAANQLRPILASIASASQGDKQAAQEAAQVWTALGERTTLTKKAFEAFGIPLQEVAKTLGVSEAAVLKMGKSGKSSIDALGIAILETQKRVQGGSLAAPGIAAAEDLIVQWTKFKELPGQIFQELSKSKGVDVLKDKLYNLYQTLSSPETIEKFAKALTKVVDWANQLDFDKISSQVDNFIDSLNYAGQILGAIGTGLGVLWDIVVGTFNLVVDVLNVFTGWLIDGYYGVVRFGDAISQFFGADLPRNLDKVLKFGSDLITSFENLGVNLIEGLVTGITGGLTKVTDAVGNVAHSAIDKFKDVLGIHSPSKEFAWMGEMSAEGFSQGLKNGVKDIDISTSEATAGLTPSGQGGLSSSGGGITIGDISCPITIEGGSNVSAEVLSARIAEQLPGALLTAIERLSQQQGR